MSAPVDGLSAMVRSTIQSVYAVIAFPIISHESVIHSQIRSCANFIPRPYLSRKILAHGSAVASIGRLTKNMSLLLLQIAPYSLLQVWALVFSNLANYHVYP